MINFTTCIAEWCCACEASKLLTRLTSCILISSICAFQGYDISFLITNFHTEQMYKHKLVDFVIHFMEEIDKEISEMKLSVNARARIVAEEFLKNVCLRCYIYITCLNEREMSFSNVTVFIFFVLVLRILVYIPNSRQRLVLLWFLWTKTFKVFQNSTEQRGKSFLVINRARRSTGTTGQSCSTICTPLCLLFKVLLVPMDINNCTLVKNLLLSFSVVRKKKKTHSQGRSLKVLPVINIDGHRNLVVGL